MGIIPLDSQSDVKSIALPNNPKRIRFVTAVAEMAKSLKMAIGRLLVQPMGSHRTSRILSVRVCEHVKRRVFFTL